MWRREEFETPRRTFLSRWGHDHEAIQGLINPQSSLTSYSLSLSRPRRLDDSKEQKTPKNPCCREGQELLEPKRDKQAGCWGSGEFPEGGWPGAEMKPRVRQDSTGMSKGTLA